MVENYGGFSGGFLREYYLYLILVEKTVTPKLCGCYVVGLS